MKKVLSDIGFIICVGVIVWGIASFIDVNMHNMSDYAYASWNLFNIFDLL